MASNHKAWNAFEKNTAYGVDFVVTDMMGCEISYDSMEKAQKVCDFLNENEVYPKGDIDPYLDTVENSFGFGV